MGKIKLLIFWMFCKDSCEERVWSFVLLLFVCIWEELGDIFSWLVVGSVVEKDNKVVLRWRFGIFFVRSCFLINLS